MTANEQAIWQTEGAQKRTAVQKMFADIAPSYDLLNDLICARMHRSWRKSAVQKLNLKEGQKALDVCCGTGDFMKPLAAGVGPTGKVMGIDFCLPMLEIAKEKLHSNKLTLGDACALPVQSEVFDAVSVGWGIRNVPDVDAAHRELFRVLKKGGRFVSLDMARPKNPVMRKISEFMFNSIVPKLGSIFGKTAAYTYLPKSTQKFSSREELVVSMNQAGFTDVGFRNYMFGNVCLHWGTKP